MIKKKYSTNGDKCRVTFELACKMAAKTVALCGEFNNWNCEKNLLKRGKNGNVGLTIMLKPGEYRYKYLLDGTRWVNDIGADDYATNTFGTSDSIIRI